MIFAGIDAGSRTIKVALFDGERGEWIASALCDQGVEQESLARSLFERLLADNGLERPAIGRVVATGYGRNLLSFADATITEITCHAVGVRHVAPDARTIIEIGGQDSKLIRLNGHGLVQDFAMNDRCAAGTGRFLEVVAARLGVDLNELGRMARRSRAPSAISSMCVVFAETEIIGLLAQGAAPADIAAGVQASIASRVSAMAGRRLDEPALFTGGVALVPGMLDALRAVLERPVLASPHPQMTGALGAAILASRPNL
ncbi:MAG: acyl-CoA dehydratase activase [Candidatus Sumerlaeota bacterium]|nr:acyl-CoA dehydratase activase [Candidatus Sumerlaeota bacterium]